MTRNFRFSVFCCCFKPGSASGVSSNPSTLSIIVDYQKKKIENIFQIEWQKK